LQISISFQFYIEVLIQVGYLQDVGSHPIFSPLRCRIPFPGFEGFRFCVSQYEDSERVLLKNLCLTLGAKFTDKATVRVTHLICKFASGPKYEAYHKRDIPTITAEWIFECVRQVIHISCILPSISKFCLPIIVLLIIGCEYGIDK
jgi:topoisomerase (DNA) II binding protein 1